MKKMLFSALFIVNVSYALPSLPTVIALENRAYVPVDHVSTATFTVQGNTYKLMQNSQQIALVDVGVPITVSLSAMTFDFFSLNPNKFQDCLVTTELQKGEVMAMIVTGVVPLGPIVCYSMVR